MFHLIDRIRHWAVEEHRNFVLSLKSRKVDEKSFHTIQGFCSSLLTTAGIAARADQSKVEEELYDIYLYWQN